MDVSEQGPSSEGQSLLLTEDVAELVLKRLAVDDADIDTLNFLSTCSRVCRLWRGILSRGKPLPAVRPQPVCKVRPQTTPSGASDHHLARPQTHSSAT